MSGAVGSQPVHDDPALAPGRARGERRSRRDIGGAIATPAAIPTRARPPRHRRGPARAPRWTGAGFRRGETPLLSISAGPGRGEGRPGSRRSAAAQTCGSRSPTPRTAARRGRACSTPPPPRRLGWRRAPENAALRCSGVAARFQLGDPGAGGPELVTGRAELRTPPTRRGRCSTRSAATSSPTIGATGPQLASRTGRAQHVPVITRGAARGATTSPFAGPRARAGGPPGSGRARAGTSAPWRSPRSGQARPPARPQSPGR